MIMSETKLYYIWCSMKARCYCETTKEYKNYGGRGIRVCSQWRTDFMSFYDWAMANGYQEGLSIERKDVNGNYEPDNCTWITRKEQTRNKRNTIRVEYNGEVRPLVEWCEMYNVSPKEARELLKQNYTIDEILAGGVSLHLSWEQHVQRLKTKNDKEKSMLAEYLCANPGAINSKIADHMGCSVRKVQMLKAELRADGLLL